LIGISEPIPIKKQKSSTERGYDLKGRHIHQGNQRPIRLPWGQMVEDFWQMTAVEIYKLEHTLSKMAPKQDGKQTRISHS
ncbi:hypothetical protein AVEN_152500-1, partial [Araneus ventricosus]